MSVKTFLIRSQLSPPPPALRSNPAEERRELFRFMEVLLVGPRYGTWKKQQERFDQLFADHCTLGDTNHQDAYRAAMYAEIQKRLEGRRDLLQRYDPLEAHKQKERESENQKTRSTAQHTSAMTVSFSKEEMQKRALLEKKKKRPAENAEHPSAPPAKKPKAPPPPIPVPPKKKKTKAPPPPPPLTPTVGKKKKKAPPPPPPPLTPTVGTKKAPPPPQAPIAGKKEEEKKKKTKTKAPPPPPAAKKREKDKDGDVVMQEPMPDFTSPEVMAWSHINPASTAAERSERTLALVQFVSEYGSAAGDGTTLQNNALVSSGAYKALLDQRLVASTIMASAARNRKQKPRVYKLIRALFDYPHVEPRCQDAEPVSPQCYHCEKKLKKNKSALLSLAEDEAGHDFNTSIGISEIDGCLFALCNACCNAMTMFNMICHWENYYLTSIHCMEANSGEADAIAEETEQARSTVLTFFSNTLVHIWTVGDIVNSMDDPLAIPSLHEVLVETYKDTTAV